MHGIFTDDLTRARRQLAIAFEAKSASLTPNAEGTDIIGGLWHLKTLFDSAQQNGKAGSTSRTIWIFSDMMNESAEFLMPRLLEIGPERMIERAKASGLVVPLYGYYIYVMGAAPTQGLNPGAWITIKRFWQMYFSAAGATLVVYASECEVVR